MRKLGLFLFLTIFTLFFIFSLLPFTSERADAAVVYRDAAVVGKVVSYNPADNSFVIYGRLSVNDGRKWRVAETRKFYQVYPKLKSMASALQARMGSGAKAFGTFQSTPDSGDEHFVVSKVTSYDPSVDPPVGLLPAYGPGVGPAPWVGFGVAVLPKHLMEFNIDDVRDFVRCLADMRDAVMGCDGEKSEKEMELLVGVSDAKTFVGRLLSDCPLRERVALAWRSHYNSKWCLAKDDAALSECVRAVGGSAFFTGLRGWTNNLVESVPVTRPDIDKFMSSPRGGGDEVEDGPAVFFASVSAVRDSRGNITALYASGPFFTSPSALVNGIKSGTAEHSGTWRIEGRNQKRAEVLDGKKCWLSGKRMLVYDDKGNLIDYYFSLEKSLTISEFNALLDLQREIAVRGGM